MPCYYTGTEAGDRELAAEETRTALTEVTRLLCEAGAIFNKHPEINLPKGIEGLVQEAQQDRQTALGEEKST